MNSSCMFTVYNAFLNDTPPPFQNKKKLNRFDFQSYQTVWKLCLSVVNLSYNNQAHQQSSLGIHRKQRALFIHINQPLNNEHL